MTARATAKDPRLATVSGEIDAPEPARDAIPRVVGVEVTTTIVRARHDEATEVITRDSRDDQTDQTDVLARWAWKTDAQPAIDEDEGEHASPSRASLAIVVAIGAAVTGIVAAIALAGPSPSERSATAPSASRSLPDPVEPSPAEPAHAIPASVEPDFVEPAPVEPAPVEPAPVEPAAAPRGEQVTSAATSRRSVDEIPADVDADTANRSAIQQFARGNAREALAAARLATRADPDFAPGWRTLGIVYTKLGNARRSRTAFERYLDLAPDAPDAAEIRARIK